MNAENSSNEPSHRISVDALSYKPHTMHRPQAIHFDAIKSHPSLHTEHWRDSSVVTATMVQAGQPDKVSSHYTHTSLTTTTCFPSQQHKWSRYSRHSLATGILSQHDKLCTLFGEPYVIHTLRMKTLTGSAKLSPCMSLMHTWSENLAPQP